MPLPFRKLWPCCPCGFPPSMLVPVTTATLRMVKTNAATRSAKHQNLSFTIEGVRLSPRRSGAVTDPLAHLPHAPGENPRLAAQLLGRS